MLASRQEGGIPGKVQTVEGKWETYRLSGTDTRRANMEGTVSVKATSADP